MRDKDRFDATTTAYSTTNIYGLTHEDMKPSRYTYELYVEGHRVMDNIDPKYVPLVVEPFIKGGFDEICLEKVVRRKTVIGDVPKCDCGRDADFECVDDIFCNPDCYKVKDVEDKVKDKLNKYISYKL